MLRSCLLRLFLIVTVTCSSAALRGQTVIDTVPPKKSFWQSTGVQSPIAPMAFFTASALTWGEREEIRKFRNRYIPTFRHHYDDYLQYLPAVTVFGLNAAGVKGKHSMGRAAASYAFSAVIMAGLVNAIKYTAKVERPDGSGDNSFPSGHSANSFMNATFLHKEYGQYRNPLYSVGAYAAASTTAISRELNNKHWISDVLAGAGIGILSTELGYLIADRVFKDKGEHKPLRMTPFPVSSKPSYLEIRIGVATSLDPNLLSETKDLHAKTGFNLGIDGAWFFSKNFGVGGEFAFTSFPINSDKLNDELPPQVDTIVSSIYTQPMGVHYLHLGPVFSIPLTHNWFITGKINAGISAGAQGEVLGELQDDLADSTGMLEIGLIRYRPETAFSWSAGLGITKRVGRNVGIKVFTSYFNSHHDFTIEQNTNISFDPLDEPVWQYVGKDRIDFSHLIFGVALTAFLW